MTRQETISREEAVRTISRISGGSVSYAEDLYDSFFPKPVVPQYVANWYAINKDKLEFHLIDWIISSVRCTDKELTEFDKWLTDTDNNPIQTLINMHQFGYEVEKEPRYTVKIKGILEDRSFLNLYKLSNKWVFGDDDTGLDSFRVTHTRKELEEAGFDWVFDCEGVEVEEVERWD